MQAGAAPFKIGIFQRRNEALAALGLAAAGMVALLVLAGFVVLWDSAGFMRKVAAFRAVRLETSDVEAKAAYAREQAGALSQAIVGGGDRLFNSPPETPETGPSSVELMIFGGSAEPEPLRPEKQPADPADAARLAEFQRHRSDAALAANLPVVSLRKIGPFAAAPAADLKQLYESGQLGRSPLGRPGDTLLSPALPEMPSAPSAAGMAPPPAGPTDFNLPRYAGEATRRLVEERPGKGYPSLDRDISADFTVYRQPGAPEAYFRLEISLREDSKLESFPKDVLFLVDISQSISQAELEQSRKAVLAYLAGLGASDRWNIVLFSENAYYMHPDRDFVPAAEFDTAAVERFIRRRADERRTDVFKAAQIILSKIPPSTRPCNVFLVSDGKATTGVSDVQQIVHDFQRVNRDNFSVFTYNGGGGGNVYLLSLLAYRSRGQFRDCPKTADIPDDLAAFSRGFDRPVLTNVVASYTNIKTEDVCPAVLPNLYRGHPVTFWGRTEPGREVALRVAGLDKDGPREFFFRAVVPEGSAACPEVVREWARGQAHEGIAALADNPENEALRESILTLAKAHGLEEIEKMVEKKSWLNLLPWRK